MTKIKIAVSLLLLTFLLWKVHPRQIFHTFRDANFDGLIIAVALGMLMLSLRWWKWHILVKSGLQTCSRKQSLVSLLGGMAFALVTPARVGELSRALFFGKGSKTQVGALTFLDRLVDLLVVLLFASVGATSRVSPIFRVGLALTMGVMAFIVIRFESFLGLLRRRFKKGWLGARISKVEEVERNLGHGAIVQNFVLSCCLTFVDLVTFYVLLRCFVPVPFSVILFVFPLVLLTNVAPVTLSGLGLREGTAIALLGLFGISSAAAFNATFLSYLLNSVAPALAGAVYAKNMKLGFSSSGNSN
ncbi:MAG: flippase-like domain-containing protein [Acidobacteriia bacterium]|nr:flippase-like domain-containing protein [Terriglobia bacterium]